MSSMIYNDSYYANTGKGPIVVVLMNIGSPRTPTYTAVWSYLRRFLSDKRVIRISRWIWNFALYGFILPIRSKIVSQRYKSIWLGTESPLLKYTRGQQILLQRYFDAQYISGVLERQIVVTFAMTYGYPSISNCMDNVKALRPDTIIFLPLFPQPASATVGAAFDAISGNLSTWKYIPSLRFISGFSDDKTYVKCIARLIRKHWSEQFNDNNVHDKIENHIDSLKAEKLIISFHGLPMSCVIKGDTYAEHCRQTYNLLIEELNLSQDYCIMAYQSRFGFSKWLQPYLDDILKDLAELGFFEIDIVSPGFFSDCLETLNEICNEYTESFKVYTNGKGKLRYINCLNDSPEAIETLTSIVYKNIVGLI